MFSYNANIERANEFSTDKNRVIFLILFSELLGIKFENSFHDIVIDIIVKRWTKSKLKKQILIHQTKQ